MANTRVKTTTRAQYAALAEAAECLRILAHPQRLRIVQLLLTGQAYTVGQLAEVCDMSQPVTSDHLRLMQRCGFLDSRREGRAVYYNVAEPHLEQIMSCIESRFGLKQRGRDKSGS